MLIINADDWGSSRQITSRIEECFDAGVVDTVSAMVFMSDSERAAQLSTAKSIETGLHLNLTTPFDSGRVSDRLLASQQKVIKYLRRNRVAPYLYNPILGKDFDYLFKAQYDEFYRLYGIPPSRIDGHNHMHLCANVLLGNFIPMRTKVRRSFYFEKREKGLVNRSLRFVVDSMLQKKYICTDYFLHIGQFCHKGVKGIWNLQKLQDLARRADVELLLHPHQDIDYKYVMNPEFLDAISAIPRGKHKRINEIEH